MTLISTPGASNANSFVDYATANAFLTTEWVNVDDWTAATQAVAESALIAATFILVTSIAWNGSKSDYNQSLPFPGNGYEDSQGYPIDGNVIPPEVEKGTAIFALFLLEKNRLADPEIQGLGLSELRVGPITLKVDPSSEGKPDLIPFEVAQIFKPYGEVKSSATRGGGVRRLGRA